MDTQKDNEFMTVEEVANDVVAQLKDQAIDRIRHHPSSGDMHFGLGMWIRNEYIYPGKMGSVILADSVSSEVTTAVAKKVLPEYADFPYAVSLFSSLGEAYISAHRYFIDRNISRMTEAISRHYDALAAAEVGFEAVRKTIDWSSDDDDDDWDVAWNKLHNARKLFKKQTLEDLFDYDLIRRIIEQSNDATKSRIQGLLDLKDYSISDENEISSFYVPAEISYLADPALKGSSQWAVGKDALLWLLDEIDFYPEEIPLPSWLFSDDEIALEALRINGNLICFMEDRKQDIEAAKIALGSAWSSYEYISKDVLRDREALKAAFSCEQCGDLLSEDFFRKYKDDEELVKLALTASGENLSWASKRIRDNYDMVCLAIDNVDYMDNIYEKISPRLRSDKRIVARIANSPTIPFSFPPAEYRDDDEIGALLADTKIHGDRFALVGMSQRIKEKYMTEEELERWGDINPDDKE